MKRRRLILISIGFFLLVAAVLLYEILWAPNIFSGDKIVTVSKGTTFKQAVDSLDALGVIRSRALFELGGKILNHTRDLHIGKYLFRSGVANQEILEYLSTGKLALLLTVTVQEGLKVKSQARVYKKELGVDSVRYVNLAHDSAFSRSLGIEANSLEGYLLPETYLFYWQTDEERILRHMVEQLKNFYIDSLKQRATQLGMTTNQVLTLASIVEGEASLDSERTIIAGVYYNRLKKRMRLQADPTIQYIIEDGPRRLRYFDLTIESPYNTYRHYGLPPGPIGNPGRASIVATLYPMKHNYLYFVASGQGGHVFSRTYQEHQRAVQKYRRLLRVQRGVKNNLTAEGNEK